MHWNLRGKCTQSVESHSRIVTGLINAIRWHAHTMHRMHHRHCLYPTRVSSLLGPSVEVHSTWSQFRLPFPCFGGVFSFLQSSFFSIIIFLYYTPYLFSFFNFPSFTTFPLHCITLGPGGDWGHYCRCGDSQTKPEQDNTCSFNPLISLRKGKQFMPCL